MKIKYAALFASLSSFCVCSTTATFAGVVGPPGYNYYNYAFDFFAGPGSYPNDNYLFITLTTNNPETTGAPGTDVTSIFGSGSLPSLGLTGFYITGPVPGVGAANSVYSTPDYFSSISFYVSTSTPPGPIGNPLTYSYPPAGNYYIFTLIDPPGNFLLTDSFDCPGGICQPGTLTLAGPLQLTGGATPLPAALPLFATGLGALGLLGWRRKRKASAALAT
jgi:hypothetical protein